MDQKGPLPTTVQSAAVRVCRDAIHWRDDLRAGAPATGLCVGTPARHGCADAGQQQINPLIQAWLVLHRGHLPRLSLSSS